jgi:hypothetical protein
MSFIIGIAVLVFGVTFLTQFLNSKPRGPIPNPLSLGEDLLTVPFPEKAEGKEPIWDFDPKDPNQSANPAYAKDYEWGVRGQYCYWFENNGPEPVDVGLEKKGCSCQRVEVALAADPEHLKKLSLKERVERGDDSSLRWVALRKDGDPPPTPGDNVILVPRVTIKPHEAGWFRASWLGSDRQATSAQIEKRSFHATLWTMKGRAYGKQVKLVAYASYVDPIHVQSVEAEKEDRLDNVAKLGVLKADRACPVEFLCWSSTREFTPNPPAQPNTTLVKTYTLTADERHEMEKKLYRHVKAAYRLTFNAKLIQLGPFTGKVVLVKEGEHDAVGIIKGNVRDDDVRILAEPGPGGQAPDKIDLGHFNFHRGIEKSVRIETAKSVERLELLDHPVFLEMEAPKRSTQSDGPSTAWDLVVKVPPGKKDGPFGDAAAPEDCAIYLNIIRKDKEPQRIRIPVSGEASR